MRRRVRHALLVAALVAAAACGPPATTGDASVPRAASPGATATMPDGTKVSIEVVADPETRAQGLMFRSSLGADHGMLFIFPEAGAHSFWMMNTLIPLDIIWIDDARTVVHVERNVPPCKFDPCPSYGPATAVKFVLELAAGQASAHGLDAGDRLGIEGIENIVAR